MPYTYDQSWHEERRRLGGIEAMYDEFTISTFEQIGVRAGWRCLEIGGGGGSIAAKLASMGATVVATDLDTRFLDALEGIEVRRHDIVNDDLEASAFDLVHSRCLLEHLPARDLVLKRLTEALKPGGWLVVEDYDTVAVRSDGPLPLYPQDSEALIRKVNEAIIGLMESAGYDATFGRRLPGELMALGLTEVDARVHSRLIRGGSDETLFHRFSIEQLGPVLVSNGALTEDEVRRAIDRVSDPAHATMSIPMMTAWGRKV